MSLRTPARALDRPQALRRARLLNRVTIGWNVVEAVVALAAGVAAGSLGLIAFGLDSCVEVSGALALAWRLAREERTGCSQPDDRKATRALAVCFFALAGWVSVNAALDLTGGHEAQVSVVGIVVTSLSLLTMPVLARAKRRPRPSSVRAPRSARPARPGCARCCRPWCWAGCCSTRRWAGGGRTRWPRWSSRPGGRRGAAQLAGRVARRHLLRLTPVASIAAVGACVTASDELLPDRD